MKKIIIVGAGPAGLFAAYKLCKNFKVTVIDKGKPIQKRFCNDSKKCQFCDTCDILSGIGGAGFFSDGKLNFHSKIGGDILSFMSREKSEIMMGRVRKILTKFGMKEKISFDKAFSKLLEKKCNKIGIKFTPVKQLHIGSDNLRKIVIRFTRYLKKEGVEFKENMEIKRIIGNKEILYLLTKSGKKIKGDIFLFAVGQVGNKWLANEVENFGIKSKNTGVDIGVRVEVKADVMKWITKKIWEPKFIFDRHCGRNSIIRTYCVCPYGYVIREKNGNLVCVNGHSEKRKKSKNTNFALMTRVKNANDNVYEYAIQIGKKLNSFGNNRPILQNYIDFKLNKSSTMKNIEKSGIEPTLKVFGLNDINSELPPFLRKNIIYAMDKLVEFLKINQSEILIYAPEIKFDSLRMECNNDLSTNVSNLFLAGDGAGVSRGIVIASVTGLLVADSIEKRFGK